jgi:riboflavin synthase
MFTGIVSDVGQVIEMTSHGELRRPVLASAYDPASVALGASIANAGVLLRPAHREGSACSPFQWPWRCSGWAGPWRGAK